MAPELLYGARLYDEGVDLSAVGCIFGELLNNSPLFPVSHYATNLYNLFLVISCGCTVLILVTLSCSKSIHFFV